MPVPAVETLIGGEWLATDDRIDITNPADDRHTVAEIQGDEAITFYAKAKTVAIHIAPGGER
jgi:hypothetical protein